MPEIPDGNPSRFQVTELPKIRPNITEYRVHGVKCDCGYTTYAKTKEVVPASTFGPRLMSLVSLMTGIYNISRRQTAGMLRDVFGITLSLGAVSTVESRVSAAIEAPVKEIWSVVEQSMVKHADATSWLLNGKLQSLWTIATKMATVFKILMDGTTERIKPLFGNKQGTLVSDRATVFFGLWQIAKYAGRTYFASLFHFQKNQAQPSGMFGNCLITQS